MWLFRLAWGSAWFSLLRSVRCFLCRWLSALIGVSMCPLPQCPLSLLKCSSVVSVTILPCCTRDSVNALFGNVRAAVGVCRVSVGGAPRLMLAPACCSDKLNVGGVWPCPVFILLLYLYVRIRQVDVQCPWHCRDKALGRQCPLPVRCIVFGPTCPACCRLCLPHPWKLSVALCYRLTSLFISAGSLLAA